LLLANWHWIFFINLPIAIVLILLAARNLPKSRKPDNCRFDFLGALSVSLMLAGFVYGINRIDTSNLLGSLVSVDVLPFLGAAILLLVLSIYIEKRACNPIVSPALFGRRQLNITHFLSFGAGFAEASLVFIPQLAIASFHVSHSLSSFMLIPAVVAMSIGSPLLGRMIDKFGAKPVIIAGTAIMAVGMFFLGIFTANIAVFYAGTFLVGAGLSGLLGAPIRYILIGEVDLAHRSSAQGVMTVFASAGQMICAAIIGSIISSIGSSTAAFGKAYFIIGIFSAALFLASFLIKNTATVNKS
jgi:MFS family permease